MKSTAIVFVHGFLGSEDSFQQFPTHLSAQVDNTTCLVYPRYQTIGHYEIQVYKLMDWLLINCTTFKYSKVILAGHSMGGLLCCDAFRNLYIPRERSFFHYPMPQLDPIETRLLLNIVAIMTFDSPLYGLNQSLAALVLPKGIEIAPHLMPTHIEQLLPSTIQVPTPIKDVSFTLSTDWIKERVSSIMGWPSNATIAVSGNVDAIANLKQTDSVFVPDLQETTVADSLVLVESNAGLNPTWSKYSLAAVGITSLALASTISLTPLATGYALQHAEQVRIHLQFLDPILHPYTSKHARLASLQLHDISIQHFVVNCKTGRFCCEFGVDNVEFVETHIKDGIDAHMNLFDCEMMGDAYGLFLDQVVKWTKRVVYP